MSEQTEASDANEMIAAITAVDVTEPLVDDALRAYGPRGGSWRKAKAARAGKLSEVQQRMFDQFVNMRLGYVSTALIYADPLDRLPARERQAFAALLLGGVLRVYRVQGALPGNQRNVIGRVPLGASGPYHYVLRATLKEMVL